MYDPRFSWLALLPLASALVGCGDDSTSGTASTGAAGLGCEPGAGCPAIESECLAFTDNVGKDKFSLRISHLTVSQPAALTTVLVSDLLTKGVTLNYPACAGAVDPSYAIFTGDGTFSWILEFDKTAGQLRTGGAKLEADPNRGYCFVNETIGSFPVAPLEVAVPLGADGTFATQTTKAVTVPIYTDPANAANVILLPLRGVRIFDGKVSADNNCIGSYNGEALDPNNLCKEEPGAVPLFIDGAKLEGHITLEDADAVLIPELSNRTLCTLIVNDAQYVDGTACKRTAGVIDYPGDWCTGATPDDPGAAGGCGDSVKLGATFAAAGATLRSDCP